ncbi:MAG TPA: FAD-dependent oxidoreductase [bacterium]|nr:FAD-dependent oxidoreductase [bacterium]
MDKRHDEDRELDVVVVGSGAAGLSAALTAAAGGARVAVLEKSAVLGGTTAMSGAGTWIPANRHMLDAGLQDSADEALAYLRAVAPDGWAEVEEPLWRAFVEHGAETLAFIESRTPLEFELVYHPDPYVEAPGGKVHGRMLSPRPISHNILGPWRDRIRPFTVRHLFTYREIVVGPVLSRPLATLLRMAPTLVYRLLTRRVGMGNALVTGLVSGCLDHGVEIMAETPATRLLTEGPADRPARVTGVEVNRRGRALVLRAARGVVLATGGFEWDPALRAQHFPGEVGLIGSPRTNTGDGQRMAAAVGARLERMDQALIYPVLPIRYEGHRHAVPVADVYAPHCILVNRTGRRFLNEGRPNLGVVIDERAPASGLPVHLPAWRIFDAQFARKNPVVMWLGRRDRGWLRRAGSVAELAEQIDIAPAVLSDTVARFNEFARRGTDEDFHRGETVWEKFNTPDPGPEPGGNGALGTIRVPPFYAAPYDRAILATKGGPRTNERGQVLHEDGGVIAGLYCAGVAMANPIGSKAAGAGSTIGPCLTWGRICGLSLLDGEAAPPRTLSRTAAARPGPATERAG